VGWQKRCIGHSKNCLQYNRFGVCGGGVAGGPGWTGGEMPVVCVIGCRFRGVTRIARCEYGDRGDNVRRRVSRDVPDG
jgi:hypothetical protein